MAALSTSQISQNRTLIIDTFGEPLAGELLGRKVTFAEARSDSFQEQFISAMAKRFLMCNDDNLCDQLWGAGGKIYLELLGGSPMGGVPPENFDAFHQFLDRMGQKIIYVYTPCDTPPSTVLFLVSHYGNGFHRFGLSASEVDLLAKETHLFREFFQVQKVGEFKIGNVSINDLRSLLKILPAPEPVDSLEHLVKYVKIAEKFKIPYLQENCLNYLDKYLAESKIDLIFVDNLARLFAKLGRFSAFEEIEAETERRVKNFLIKNLDNPSFLEHLNDFYKSFFAALSLGPSAKTIEWLKTHEKLQPSTLQFERFQTGMGHLATFPSLKTLHFHELNEPELLKGFDSIQELIVDMSYMTPTQVFETLPHLEKLTLNKIEIFNQIEIVIDATTIID